MTDTTQPQAAAPMTVEARDALIRSWIATKGDLAVIKDRELEQRNGVAKTLFPTPKKGTQRFDLGNGYAVKLVFKYNYKFGNETIMAANNEPMPVADQVEMVMEEIEKLGNEGAFLVDRLIKTEYKLSESEYNKLDMANPTHKAIKEKIDRILVVTPATPALEFEEPKAK